MSDRLPDYIDCRTSDGTTRRCYIPRRAADVDNQPDIPAYALALLAFAQVVDGRVRWSDFTRLQLKRLQDRYGDKTLRLALSNLLDDIRAGLRANNPIGLLIHRVRCTATSDDLTI